MKATQFTIDRAKWGCGKRTHKNLLLNRHDGSMCCLGFYALACGLTEGAIEGVTTYIGDDMTSGAASVLPTDLVTIDEEFGELTETKLHRSLIEANDHDFYTPAARESRIAELFSTMGVRVDFTGSYPPAAGEG